MKEMMKGCITCWNGEIEELINVRLDGGMAE